MSTTAQKMDLLIDRIEMWYVWYRFLNYSIISILIYYKTKPNNLLKTTTTIIIQMFTPSEVSFTLNSFQTRAEPGAPLCIHFETSSPEELPCSLLQLDSVERSPWHGSDKDRPSGGQWLLAVGATRCVSGSSCPVFPPHHAVLHAPGAATSTGQLRSPRQIGPLTGYIDWGAEGSLLHLRLQQPPGKTGG